MSPENIGPIAAVQGRASFGLAPCGETTHARTCMISRVALRNTRLQTRVISQRRQRRL